MRIFNRYLIILGLSITIIDIILAFAGQNDLSVYFIFNVIAYLIITLLHVYLNPKARKALSNVTVVLFSGFLVIVAIKVFDIIAK